MENINGATVVLGDAAGAEPGLETLTGEQLGGDYTVIVGSGPANTPGPALHRHPATDEAFYVADGELTVVFEDREIVACPGTFAFIPRGTVHTAHSTGDSPLRGVILISPAGAEHTFDFVEADR